MVRSDAAETAADNATEPSAPGRGRVKRVWVQNVDVNVALLEAKLDSLEAQRHALKEGRKSSSSSRGTRRLLAERFAAEQALDQHVRQLLKRAQDAAHRRHPVPNRFVNWWGGRLIEAAYQNLHGAEAALAGLYDWDDIEAEVPEAIARVEAGLQRDDPRREAARGLVEFDRESSRLDHARAALTKAIAVGHAVADHEHSRLRNFRNAVLVSGVVIGLLLLFFGSYVWFNPTTVPLCFTPSNAEGEPATWVCPTGSYPWDSKLPTEEGPTSKHDILVVLLLGVLGGAMSAAVSIRGMTGASTPYDVPLALAALKLPLGALTALGTLIALQGDFVPGLSELDSQGQILAYALVFGYAQQLLSGMLDRKAQSLLETAPGKERDMAFPARGAQGQRRVQATPSLPARLRRQRPART